MALSYLVLFSVTFQGKTPLSLPEYLKEEKSNMRNLKKILALVLALVMSLSLMATASATDFKDDESIDSYQLAIEVLSGLKVFGGDQNGNFNPKDPIRRSEVEIGRAHV